MEERTYCNYQLIGPNLPVCRGHHVQAPGRDFVTWLRMKSWHRWTAGLLADQPASGFSFIGNM